MTTTQDLEYTYELTLPQILRVEMERHGDWAYVALGAAISAVHGLSPTTSCRVRVTYGDEFEVEVYGPESPQEPIRQVVVAAIVGAWATCAVVLTDQVTIVDFNTARVPHA